MTNEQAKNEAITALVALIAGLESGDERKIMGAALAGIDRLAELAASGLNTKSEPCPCCSATRFEDWTDAQAATALQSISDRANKLATRLGV